MGNVKPGALFRLPDGTTGIVTCHPDPLGRMWASTSQRGADSVLVLASDIAPHIICEPGDGPIRGNDAALRGSLSESLNEAVAEVARLEGALATMTRKRDAGTEKIRDLIKKQESTQNNDKALADAQARAARMEAERNNAVSHVDAVTHERDALRAEFKADHEALVAKIAAFEDACGLVTADGAPVEYDLSTLSFQRVDPDYEAEVAQSHTTLAVIRSLDPLFEVMAAFDILTMGHCEAGLKIALKYLRFAVVNSAPKVEHPKAEFIASMVTKRYPDKVRRSAEAAIRALLSGNYEAAVADLEAALSVSEQ